MRIHNGLVFIVAPRLTAALSLVVPIGGITLWPLVLCDRPVDQRLVLHESIHGRQWVELGSLGLLAWLLLAPLVWSPAWVLALPVAWWGPFLALYSGFYFVARIRGFDAETAYAYNPFEMEAHRHDRDPSYLERRPFMAWSRFA